MKSAFLFLDRSMIKRIEQHFKTELRLPVKNEHKPPYKAGDVLVAKEHVSLANFKTGTKPAQLTLSIVSVELATLKDVTEAQAKREGIEVMTAYVPRPQYFHSDDSLNHFPTAREAYLDYWVSKHGESDHNPKVWVITFATHKKSITKYLEELEK